MFSSVYFNFILWESLSIHISALWTMACQNEPLVYREMIKITLVKQLNAEMPDLNSKTKWWLQKHSSLTIYGLLHGGYEVSLLNCWRKLTRKHSELMLGKERSKNGKALLGPRKTGLKFLKRNPFKKIALAKNIPWMHNRHFKVGEEWPAMSSPSLLHGGHRWKKVLLTKVKF